MTAPVHGPLQRLRDRCSVVQIAIATATVALADGIAPWSLGIASALAVLAFVRPLPPETSRSAERLWTIGIAMALFATLARAVLRGDILDAGVDFLLLLVVQRLFNRQRTREHMQLLLLGSLLVVAGAVINAGINYPFLFAAYLVVATMTLLLNHLVSEGERLGLRTAVTVAREGMRARAFLWRAAVQVALIAGIGAVVTFVVFPRWGVGVFLRGGFSRDSQSGFSSTVELGDFGRIKTDATVVMRIEPTEGASWGPRPTWHLRGSSFDAYEGGRWYHAQDSDAEIADAPYGYKALRSNGHIPLRSSTSRALPAIVEIAGFERSLEVLFATVTLEDIGVDVLFAASSPLAVRLSPRGPIESRARIRGGRSDELRADKGPGPIRYQFVSRVGLPSTDELRAQGDPTPSEDLAPYLQRAPGLSDDVGGLARQLTAGATTRYDKIDAIAEHLATFAYSLDNPVSDRVRAGADPLEGFLFDTQAGHCEYFATALAVLGREVGVPTRIVNGYYGAHWNPVGEYYAVRQADAHSWVEVHMGELGWVTVDPTPPSGLVAGDDASWWPAAAELIDAARNAYLEWVIDYDLGKQLSLFENLGLRDRAGQSGLARWRRLLFAALGIATVAWGIARWRRRKRVRIAAETTLWKRVLGKLARRGWTPTAGESAPRFAARVAAGEPAIAAELRAFARAYEACRFAPPERHEPSLAALHEATARLLAALAGRTSSVDAAAPP
jgi:transglutaminase-like putative cysteine protease